MINWRTTVQDLVEDTPLRGVVFTRHVWALVILAALLTIGGGIGGGWLLAEVGVIPVAALVIGLGYFAWMLQNIEIAYLGVIGIVTLLPFASLPINIGFTPTFLDMALGGLFFVWSLSYALGEEQSFLATPAGGPVFVFALFAIVSFVAGLSHGAMTTYLIRHFAEVLLSIALFYLVVNTVRDVGRLRRLMRWLIVCATAASALGIALYFTPDETAIRALSALGRLGYPVGPGVLRYIRDDPTLMQRATSTSVDPNVLGSLLNMAMVMATPQLFAKRPLLPRVILIPCLGVLGLGLGLTISRSAMVGMAMGVFALAVLRYRKLLPWFALAAILVLLLPWTQSYVDHFIEGIRGEDLSTQMRMGEYKDAFILIRRYPFLGVGFAGAPDLDIYIGVASTYLIIAQQMGLIGLTTFLVVVGVLFVGFWRHRRAATSRSDLEPLWYGIHAALLGGLISGVFDHYFFSLDFHHSVTLFWLVFGLAAAATEIASDSSSSSPSPPLSPAT
ncbi:MAG: O-antigen ligase family protein [Anaerolineales bacterium]